MSMSRYKIMHFEEDLQQVQAVLELSWKKTVFLLSLVIIIWISMERNRV